MECVIWNDVIALSAGCVDAWSGSSVSRASV